VDNPRSLTGLGPEWLGSLSLVVKTVRLHECIAGLTAHESWNTHKDIHGGAFNLPLTMRGPENECVSCVSLVVKPLISNNKSEISPRIQKIVEFR
jgi:hypothetical protein